MPSIFVAGTQKTTIPLGFSGKALYLLRLLEGIGLTLSENPNSEYILSIDHNIKDYEMYIEHGGSAERAFLLRLEPETVVPKQFEPDINKKYAMIFSPGRSDNFINGDHALGWPYKYDTNPISFDKPDIDFREFLSRLLSSEPRSYLEWDERPILASMITSNKFSFSPKDNYNIRRKIAKELESFGLQVYGTLWNLSLFKALNYRIRVLLFSLRQRESINFKNGLEGVFFKTSNYYGVVPNKHEVLEKSKFTIVIENCNSYASEKLFDAIISGCIPIYIGPSLDSIKLPPAIAFSTNGESKNIIKILTQASRVDIEKMLLQGQEFLKSNIFKENWTEHFVYTRIAIIMRNHISRDIV